VLFSDGKRLNRGRAVNFTSAFTQIKNGSKHIKMHTNWKCRIGHKLSNKLQRLPTLDPPFFHLSGFMCNVGYCSIKQWLLRIKENKVKAKLWNARNPSTEKHKSMRLLEEEH